MLRWLTLLVLAGAVFTARAETVPAEELTEETSTGYETPADDWAEAESDTQDLEQPATPPGALPMVTIRTSKGDIRLELYPEQAPVTVENFLAYVDNGHYQGTIFHRVISGFMIQGGGFTSDLVQKPTLAPIKNEANNGLTNDRGTIAMARTQIIDSATSQFFINVVDNANLNFRSPDPAGFGYCVFGRVVEGMDVVDAIRNVQTGVRNHMRDVPVETVEILDVIREG
jgi:cyclophilin family peptidyl-prolyl cis-trans isomerase